MLSPPRVCTACTDAAGKDARNTGGTEGSVPENEHRHTRSFWVLQRNSQTWGLRRLPVQLAARVATEASPLSLFDDTAACPLALPARPPVDLV